MMARQKHKGDPDYWREKLNGDISRDVRKRRLAANILQCELAERAGITNVHLCYLENGKRPWNTRIQARILAALERLGA